jgi:hypothetical protein
LQADSGSSEPKSFCGPAEGRAFCLLRPLARLLLQRHDPADGARPRDTSGRGPWGQSGFSPETARSTSARSATWRAMAHRAVSFSQDRVRGSGAVPITGSLCRASHAGHRRGRRFPSATRRLRAPGLGSSPSSNASASPTSRETAPFPRGCRIKPFEKTRSTLAEVHVRAAVHNTLATDRMYATDEMAVLGTSPYRRSSGRAVGFPDSHPQEQLCGRHLIADG